MKRIVLLLVITFACSCLAQAQSEASLSWYNAALGYYNPASAGRSGELNITALYNINMLGWDDNTLFASADMPFKLKDKEHGVGVVVVKDNQSSLYNDLRAGLQYAFLKKIGKGTLRTGLQLGMISRSVGGDNVITPSDDEQTGGEGGGSSGGSDPAIPTTKVESKAFDMNFGLFYATDKWYVGAAVTHILEPEMEDENMSTYLSRGYNFIGGYNIRMNNPLFELQPSVFMQINANMIQADITAKAVYARRYSAGLSWSTSVESLGSGSSIALMLGATFGKIEGGYAYTVPLSQMAGNTLGGQELYLKYRLQLNKPKTGKSKHKSVRIL
jgi:type IX secretion system PorP/SprF family membrane protein